MGLDPNVPMSVGVYGVLPPHGTEAKAKKIRAARIAAPALFERPLWALLLGGRADRRL